MASSDRRVPENSPGPLFVDDSCIDCDACRWIAPETFDRGGESQSRVFAQPETDAQMHRALMALVACPTASIGTEHKQDLKPVLASYPDRLGEGHPVFHCGYHDESSFGATTYLIQRDAGNILVDAPRFAMPLVKNIEALGGVELMFLTHRDDVGDHEKWAKHFGCECILHRDDVSQKTRGVEHQLEGTEPIRWDDEVKLLPVPGHTQGSMVLNFRDTYLFTGDHLAWSWRLERVYAFRRACWYSWERQIESMRRTAELSFEWILPGHARRCHFPREEMRGRMLDTVAWMEEQ